MSLRVGKLLVKFLFPFFYLSHKQLVYLSTCQLVHLLNIIVCANSLKETCIDILESIKTVSILIETLQL